MNGKVTVDKHDNALDRLDPVISTYTILDHANFPGVLRIRMCLPWFMNEVSYKNLVRRCGRNLFIVNESSLSHDPFQNNRDIQVVDSFGMFGGAVVCIFSVLRR